MKTLKEVEVEVEVNGKKFRANRGEDGTVEICQWNDSGCFWEWAGTGTWSSCVENCTANIGNAAYAAIDDAITEAE